MSSSANIKICGSCHTDSPGDIQTCARCGQDIQDAPVRLGDGLAGLEINGKYRLAEAVGEGAMGWVYRATHRTLKTDVAVKLMKPAGDDPDRQQRFEREARVTSRLSHPHVISVTDFGRTPGGMLYIVSEFLRGTLLTDLLRDAKPVPLGRSLTIFHQLLAAVEEAHSVGVVHRDIKPDNIMITPLRSGEDFVKVLDFGITQLADAGEATDPARRRGEVCGTPAYMAPEQIRGESVTARSDLYACGLILYELLTGRAAWSSTNMMEVLAQQLHASPVPLRTAAPDMDYPEELERVVTRVLSKDAADRYGTASELREALFGSVESIRQAQVPCRACHNRPDSSWSPYCRSCAFRPTYAGAGRELSSLSEQPVVTRQSARLTTPEDNRRQARAPGVSTAVTVQMPAVTDSGPREEPRKTRQRLRAVPYTGRDRELDAVDQFLVSPDTVLEVVGDPGAGKSVLLDQAACRVLGRTVRAGADPTLACTPWYPVRHAVAAVLGLDTAQPNASQLRQRAIEAGLVPEDVPGLVDLFGLTRTAEGVAPRVRARETRAAAQRALLHSTLAHQGYCLLLDDVDEFDSASLRFVRHLADAVVPGTVKLVLATHRAVLPGDGSHVSIYLGPLSLTALEDLVTRAAPHQWDTPRLAQILLSRSGGNALHAEQALLLLSEGGGLLDGNLDELVRARVGRLSEAGLRLLQTLCLIGNHAASHLLMKLLPDAVELTGAIEELSDAGYVRSGDGLLEVRSPTLAGIVRALTEPTVRRTINRALYERLSGQGARLIERARHAAEAQLGEEALELLLEAGELAGTWLDDEGAATHFRRALDIARWELLMGEEDERLPLISLKLGDALRRSEHHLAAEMTYKEALSASSRYPLLRARLHCGLAKLLIGRGLVEEGLAAMHQALSTAQAGNSAALLAEMYVVLSEMLRELGKTEAAGAELDEGIFLVTAGDGVRTSAPPQGFWKLLVGAAEVKSELDDVRAAEVKSELDDVRAAEDLATLALAHAKREQSVVGQAQSHLVLARLADGPDAEAVFEEHSAAALAAFKRLGDRRSAAECLLLRAARGGRGADDLVSQALALAEQIDWSEGVSEANRLL